MSGKNVNFSTSQIVFLPLATEHRQFLRFLHGKFVAITDLKRNRLKIAVNLKRKTRLDFLELLFQRVLITMMILLHISPA